MVVIHVKRTEADQFLVETTVTESNDALIRRLVRIWNGRLLLLRLADAAEQLAEHGVAKVEEERGLDDKTVAMSRKVEAETPGGRPMEAGTAAEREGRRLCSALGHSAPGAGAGAAAAAAAGASSGASSGAGGSSGALSLPPGWRACPDPSEQRTGVAPPEAQANTIRETVAAARALVHKDAVRRRVALTEEAIAEAKANVGGAVTIAYPMGLPECDPIRDMLAGTEDVEGLAVSAELLEEDTAQLWFAGKEFDRAQTVGDRVGRNEKTKVIGRLQKRGGGPPVREPAISEAERKAMMAHYFKKQQELKELAEDDTDDFMAASWADPKALKRGLTGATNVRFR